jgi:PAS domain S-box-containing protein
MPKLNAIFDFLDGTAHRTEDLTKRLLAFTGDGVYRYTFDEGRILAANNGLVKILELDCYPETLIGKQLKDVLVYTTREGEVRRQLDNYGEVHNFHYHFRTMKGNDKWVIHDAFLVRDPASGARIVETIVKDITAIKLAEMKIALEKERLVITLRSIGDGVIATDAEGKVTLINPVAQALTGWSEAEAIGQPSGAVFRIIDINTRQAGEDPLAKTLQTGLTERLDRQIALIARDGTERNIADCSAAIRDAAGKVVGAIMVFRDIPARKLMEQ